MTFRKIQIMVLKKDYGVICDAFTDGFLNNSSVAPQVIFNMKNSDKAILFTRTAFMLMDILPTTFNKGFRDFVFFALQRITQPRQPREAGHSEDDHSSEDASDYEHPPHFGLSLMICPFCRANVFDTQPIFLNIECEVCFEHNKMNRLSCGHVLCDKCTTKLENE
jgi:hypothetical protein